MRFDHYSTCISLLFTVHDRATSKTVAVRAKQMDALPGRVSSELATLKCVQSRRSVTSEEIHHSLRLKRGDPLFAAALCSTVATVMAATRPLSGVVMREIIASRVRSKSARHEPPRHQTTGRRRKRARPNALLYRAANL